MLLRRLPWLKEGGREARTGISVACDSHLHPINIMNSILATKKLDMAFVTNFPSLSVLRSDPFKVQIQPGFSFVTLTHNFKFFHSCCMAKQETTISVDISSLEFRAIRVSAQNLEAGGRQRPGPNSFLMIDAQPSRCPNSTLMIRFRVIIFSLFRFFSVYCFNFLVRFLLGLASRSLMALLSTAACKRRLVSLR